MLKYRTLIMRMGALSALVLAAGSAAGQQDWAALCNPEGNQQEITACVAAEEQDARARLDETLAKIADRYADEEDQLAALDAAQASWEEQVQADIDAYLFVPEGENPQFLYGSSYAMSLLDARIQLIDQRTEFLETQWLPDR